MRLGLGVLVAVLALVGCRTLVDLNAKPVVESTPEGPKREGCDVHEFPAASDVPGGARSMGLLQVKREGSDEDTKAALLKAICEKGGDGFSSLHWVKEPGVWEPTALEATVWDLP